MSQIKKSGRNVSMLVANNNAIFPRKLLVEITFTCGGWPFIADA